MCRFAFLGLCVFLVTGCRIEERAEPAPPVVRLDSVAVGESLRTEGPPVMAGDTLRLDSTEAGAGDPAPPVAPAQPDAPPVVVPSGLVIPVQGIEPDDLVDTFDDARGQGRVHDAIDILAPRGTPVMAATDGRILRLFTSDKGGLTIYQLGRDRRTVYYYAHLDAYAAGLAKDQTVRRGQVIGTVGDTGNAAPGNYHLHFAMWTVSDPASFWDGTPINPYPVLGGR